MRNTRSSTESDFRILLVQEDVPEAREVVRSFSRVALNCRHVSDGRALPAVLSAVEPHLVLLDNGVDDVARTALSRFHQTRRIPIILMTQENIASVDPLVQTLADDYVLKPFDSRMLALRVIAHLRQLEPPEKPAVATRPTEWLPYGWAACEACGYRGRNECFAPARPDCDELKLPESYIFNARAKDELHSTLCCPRCGRKGSVSAAVA